ncbi:MAG TPA: hypothetical protein VG939_22415 [Caulobacteraceae bacterium]|nr:hypothetical protein [Caulobacteraceae bacterium]
MTYLKTFLAAAAFAAVATPALASDSDVAFKGFQTVCGATAAEFPDVVKAAEGDGWKNAQVLGDSMAKVSITDKAARTKTIGAMNLILSTNRGLAQTPGGALTVSDCTVRSDQGEAAALEAAAQGWLGFAGTGGADRMAWHFTRDGGAIKPVTDNGDAAAAGAGLEILTVYRSGASLTMDLMKIRK